MEKMYSVLVEREMGEGSRKTRNPGTAGKRRNRNAAIGETDERGRNKPGAGKQQDQKRQPDPETDTPPASRDRERNRDHEPQSKTAGTEENTPQTEP